MLAAGGCQTLLLLSSESIVQRLDKNTLSTVTAQYYKSSHRGAIRYIVLVRVRE